MTSTLAYLKEWQKALQIEIQHFKKHGSSKYSVKDGRLVSDRDGFTYYFETDFSIRIPVGSIVRLEQGSERKNGRILSSEGKSIILTTEHFLGDFVSEAFLYHDPWELLEQLILRLDEIKKSKRKRLRIKKLLDPSMPAKHPAEKSKSNVHELFLRSKYNPVTYVWGPPGTGKTYTLARVAANHHFKGKNVLILSHSNQAVDILMDETAQYVKKKKRFRAGGIIRYGTIGTDSSHKGRPLTTTELIEKGEPKLAENKKQLIEARRNIKNDLLSSFSKRDSDYLLELETKLAKVLEKYRQKEMQLLKEASIIGTTLAKAASDSSIYEKQFDVVIVDEASMAFIPQVAFAASLGERVIICGDFKQLAPIAISRHALVNQWLKEDIFHASGVVERTTKEKLHVHLFLLNEQRRMHPEISAFTNKYVYQSLVEDHESVYTSRNKIVEQAPFPGRASILLDSSHSGKFCFTQPASHSRINIWQLLQSFQLIHESYLAGARSIGYVTPYRAQASMMELLLSSLYERERTHCDILASTVHRFQGSERDVIIFDTVDSHPMERAGYLVAGQESERLINVAITRTRGKFIHVGDASFIQDSVYQNKTIRQLVEHQKTQGQSIQKHEIGTWVKNQLPRLQWMHAKKLEQAFQDISLAKSSVILSLPNGTGLPEDWLERLKKRPYNVSLTIMSDRPIHEVQPDLNMSAKVDFPFMIIDECLLWLGHPWEAMIGSRPPHVAARLDSTLIAKHLISLFEGK
ncbi:AAA domain-containing protein [Bacillus sp. V5-8f]|uniref:AAA domain-containing protein n=1 Tax=Bacillus sp. V5-8f TaxID=2053044 RepID=UPI000C78286C|nr:AAA domain-containing protein [Bacillus sp. V5-8f]PLT35542.1 DNA helicase [Bacillus sp. V5-8f]